MINPIDNSRLQELKEAPLHRRLLSMRDKILTRYQGEAYKHIRTDLRDHADRSDQQKNCAILAARIRLLRDFMVLAPQTKDELIFVLPDPPKEEKEKLVELRIVEEFVHNHVVFPKGTQIKVSRAQANRLLKAKKVELIIQPEQAEAEENGQERNSDQANGAENNKGEAVPSPKGET